MILDDIGIYLEQKGIGTLDTDIFLARIPKEIEGDCIAVYEYAGLASIHTSANGPGEAAAERPRIQIVCRSDDYQKARQRAHDIFRSLDGLAELTINGTRYLYVHALSPPFPGKDNSDRFLIICNYQVVKEIHG